MQSTFGVEVLESRSGSFVKIVTKKYRKISSDGFQRGGTVSNDKKKKDLPIQNCGSCLVCVHLGMDS